jgi:hypothetical protein
VICHICRFDGNESTDTKCYHCGEKLMKSDEYDLDIDVEIEDEPTRRTAPPEDLLIECTPTRVCFRPREREWFGEKT